MLVLNQFIRGQGKHICIRTYILRILFIYFLLLKIHTLTKSLNYRNKTNTEILKTYLCRSIPQEILKWGSKNVRAPPPGPLRRGVVPLTGYPPSSQGFLSPLWARTWDHELRYPFEVVPTTNWASSSVGSGNYLEWVSKLMVPGSSPRRRKKPL